MRELRRRVGGGESDDGATRCLARGDSGRRVLDDHALLGVGREPPRCQQVAVGGRFARRHVVGVHLDGGQRKTGRRETAVHGRPVTRRHESPPADGDTAQEALRAGDRRTHGTQLVQQGIEDSLLLDRVQVRRSVADRVLGPAAERQFPDEVFVQSAQPRPRAPDPAVCRGRVQQYSVDVEQHRSRSHVDQHSRRLDRTGSWCCRRSGPGYPSPRYKVRLRPARPADHCPRELACAG